MKIENPDDLRALADACNDFAMLPFWPENARSSVMRMLAELCPHREALRWLVAETIKHVGKWPGPAELRGILCSRYDPADGIDAYSTIPGYTPDDAEMRYVERERETFARLPEPRFALRLLAADASIASANALPPASKPPIIEQTARRQEFKPTPVSQFERNLLRAEANDETLGVEARERAKRILARLDSAEATG